MLFNLAVGNWPLQKSPSSDFSSWGRLVASLRNWVLFASNKTRKNIIFRWGFLNCTRKKPLEGIWELQSNGSSCKRLIVGKQRFSCTMNQSDERMKQLSPRKSAGKLAAERNRKPRRKSLWHPGCAADYQDSHQKIRECLPCIAGVFTS